MGETAERAMTANAIIGWIALQAPDFYKALSAHIESAITAAVAEEREACAQVADEHWDRHARDCRNHSEACFREIAAAIRARSNP